MATRKPTRLPPEVNRQAARVHIDGIVCLPQGSHLLKDALPVRCRVLFVRNLPYNISAEEMFEVFGKYGAVRQIRVGSTKDTRGTAYVVYEDIYDAKAAQEHLSGFNVQNRYLIVLYHQNKRQTQKMSTKEQEEELRRMQEKYGVSGEQEPPAKRGGG